MTENKEKEMEKLFKRLPWLEEQFKTEQAIIKQIVMVEREYVKFLQKIEWIKSLD